MVQRGIYNLSLWGTCMNIRNKIILVLRAPCTEVYMRHHLLYGMLRTCTCAVCCCLSLRLETIVLDYRNVDNIQLSTYNNSWKPFMFSAAPSGRKHTLYLSQCNHKVQLHQDCCSMISHSSTVYSKSPA